MDYANAKKGIRRIFIGEILALISIITAVIAMIHMFVKGRPLNSAASFVSANTSSGGLFFLSSAIALAAFILTIVGISNASKDETNFKNAMAALFVSIIANIAQSAVTGRGALVEGLFIFVGTFCEFLVTYYVVSGTLNLARAVHDRDVQVTGLATLKLILIFYAVILVLDVVATVLSAKQAFAAGTIVNFLAVIVSLVAGLIYFRLLNQARQML